MSFSSSPMKKKFQFLTLAELEKNVDELQYEYEKYYAEKQKEIPQHRSDQLDNLQDKISYSLGQVKKEIEALKRENRSNSQLTEAELAKKRAETAQTLRDGKYKEPRIVTKEVETPKTPAEIDAEHAKRITAAIVKFYEESANLYNLYGINSFIRQHAQKAAGITLENQFDHESRKESFELYDEKYNPVRNPMIEMTTTERIRKELATNFAHDKEKLAKHQETLEKTIAGMEQLRTDISQISKAKLGLATREIYIEKNGEKKKDVVIEKKPRGSNFYSKEEIAEREKTIIKQGKLVMRDDIGSALVQLAEEQKKAGQKISDEEVKEAAKEIKGRDGAGYLGKAYYGVKDLWSRKSTTEPVAEVAKQPSLSPTRKR